ncbi:MAG TPA: OmpA family protein [Puia sp.]|nr:OmpA family protein [Puia sp.]
MIPKIAALTLCFTAIVGLAGAQELGIEVDGGLQGMRYSLQNGKSTLQPGASLGINHVFRLYRNFGLLTGVTGGLYRTQATLPNSMAFAYPEVDDQGAAFLYNVRFTGYKETERTLAVIIPVLFQYHTDGAAAQWYIDAGAKVFFPVNTSIQVTAQQMSLSGYYPNYDLVVSDLPKHGFGTAGGWKSSTSTQLEPGAALSAGTGLAFGISRGVRLYAGVYIDYGLTALKTGRDSMPVVTYSPSGIGNVKANGVFSTSNAGQPKLLSFGLQLRLTWGATPAKKTTRPAKSATRPEKRTTRPEKRATRPAEKVDTILRPLSPAGAPISDSELITIQRPIIFGIVGETNIPEIQTAILDDVVTIMQQHPDLRISVVGYTCDGLQQAEDSKLGDARARAVARYLEHKGIDRHRMDISYDKQSAPSKAYDPAANYRNRRVLISPE